MIQYKLHIDTLDFDELLEEGFVAHRIYIIDDPDMHVLGTLLEEADAAGVVFTRSCHDEYLVGVFAAETAGYGLELVKGYAAGLAAFARNKGRDGVTHKDHINFVDRIDAYGCFVTYRYCVFLGAVPIDHGTDYGISELTVASGRNVVNVKLKDISGFGNNMAYHFVLKSEGDAALCYMKVSDDSDLHETLEEKYSFAETLLRKNIVAELISRGVLDRLFYRRNVFVPSVSETFGDVPDCTYILAEIICETPG